MESVGEYIVFRRSARNWEEFTRARRFVIRKGLTLEQARTMCRDFNDNRSLTHVRRGTKYEFCPKSEF